MVDGKSLIRSLRELLNEDSTSSWLNTRSSYEFLWQAANELVSRTFCLRSTQSITTVANQSGYTLKADFLKLYLKNDDGEFYIKYNDGTNDYFKTYKEYSDIIYENNTTSVSIPDNFTIIDDPDIDVQLSSTVTSVGASVGGRSTLTDAATDLSDVSAGDIVHNLTDGSDGVVTALITSSGASVGGWEGAGVITQLYTALFGGTNNDWTLADSYVIQPQARLKFILDPPPSNSGHTVTVYYIQRPLPVYHDYGVYRIQPQYSSSLVQYAAWLYKYRDKEPNFGDKWFQFFDRTVRHAGENLGNAFVKKKIEVSFKGR